MHHSCQINQRNRIGDKAKGANSKAPTRSKGDCCHGDRHEAHAQIINTELEATTTTIIRPVHKNPSALNPRFARWHSSTRGLVRRPIMLSHTKDSQDRNHHGAQLSASRNSGTCQAKSSQEPQRNPDERYDQTWVCSPGPCKHRAITTPCKAARHSGTGEQHRPEQRQPRLQPVPFPPRIWQQRTCVRSPQGHTKANGQTRSTMPKELRPAKQRS